MDREEAIKLIQNNPEIMRESHWKHKIVEEEYYGKYGGVWKEWKISQQLMNLGEAETLSLEQQYKIFKEQVKILDKAEQAGITIKDRGSYAQITCPNPEHPDNNPSCVVWKNINAFKCYSCGASGDVIEFVRLIKITEKKK